MSATHRRRVAMNLSGTDYYDFEFGPSYRSFVGEVFIPYEIEIRAGNLLFIFGRFSIGTMGRIAVLSKQPTTPKTVFTAGAFSEANPTSKILIGDGHNITGVFHNSFGAYGRIFSHYFSNESKNAICVEAAGVTLGRGVILSAGSTVIDGVAVGDGTVIAAGAVAVRECEPYSIYGGVPAKKLKSRLTNNQIKLSEALDLEHVRSHCMPDVPWLMAQVEGDRLSLQDAKSKLEYMPEIPRIVIGGTIGSNNELIVGDIQSFRVGNRTITDEFRIKALRDYFDQAKSAQSKLKWSPDVFHAIGAS